MEEGHVVGVEDEVETLKLQDPEHSIYINLLINKVMDSRK